MSEVPNRRIGEKQAKPEETSILKLERLQYQSGSIVHGTANTATTWQITNAHSILLIYFTPCLCFYFSYLTLLLLTLLLHDMIIPSDIIHLSLVYRFFLFCQCWGLQFALFVSLLELLCPVLLFVLDKQCWFVYVLGIRFREFRLVSSSASCFGQI